MPVRVWLGSSWVGVGLEGTCASVLGRLSVIDFWNIFRELAGEYPWQGLIHIGVGTLYPPMPFMAIRLFGSGVSSTWPVSPFQGRSGSIVAVS